MDNEQSETPKKLPGKKEMKKLLADKMETALPELRTMLGEKKFANRIKKAAKLLMEGLHKEDVAKSKMATTKTATKKAVTKKASVKKTAAKKGAAKGIKQAKVPRKAKAGK